MPDKSRHLVMRATPEMVRLVDSFRPRYSLPGRPASRTYAVECLVIEGTRALVRNNISGAPDGAPAEIHDASLQKIQQDLDAIEQEREAVITKEEPVPPDDADETEDGR